MTTAIKQAITTKLTQLYPKISVYDEKVSQLDEGGFFIYIKKHDYEKEISNRYKSTVVVELIYYPSTAYKMKEMEEIKLEIFKEFDLVGGFRLLSKTASIMDDRLNMNMTIKYTETKNTESTLMQAMTSELKQKED